MTEANRMSIADLRKTATMPAKKAGFGSVQAFFEAKKDSIALVLPKHMDAERMMRIAYSALRTTPKLMECSVASLLGGVVQCAQLGLECNTPQGHAYLVPFAKRGKDEHGNWTNVGYDVQVIFGYRGLIDLAYRSGKITHVAAHAVYQGDEFNFQLGIHEDLVHKPGKRAKGAEITHFYAVAKLKSGGYAFEVMSVESVLQIRDNSEGWKIVANDAKKRAKSPWEAHFEEMGRKTALRRLYKYLPVSLELAQANDIEDRAQRGDAPDLSKVLEGDEYITDMGNNPYAQDDDDDDSQVDATADHQDKADEKPQTAKATAKADAKPETEASKPGSVDSDGVVTQDPKVIEERMRSAKTVDELELAFDFSSDLSAEDREPLARLFNVLQDKLANPSNKEPDTAKTTTRAKRERRVTSPS